jgi:hypothetical protein
MDHKIASQLLIQKKLEKKLRDNRLEKGKLEEEKKKNNNEDMKRKQEVEMRSKLRLLCLKLLRTGGI